MSQIKFEVEDCRDCLMLKESREMGCTLKYCGHPSSPKGYESVIESKTFPNPTFCPLNSSELIIIKKDSVV